MQKATREIPTEIHTTLHRQGGRMSKARKEIITVLNNSAVPMSIQEIASKVSADETSVYRTIAFLVSNNLAEEIRVPYEYARYALSHDHHHHVICRSCGFVVHIPCTSSEIIHVSHEKFIRILDHAVTHYGICTKCA